MKHRQIVLISIFDCSFLACVVQRASATISIAHTIWKTRVLHTTHARNSPPFAQSICPRRKTCLHSKRAVYARVIQCATADPHIRRARRLKPICVPITASPRVRPTRPPPHRAIQINRFLMCAHILRIYTWRLAGVVVAVTAESVCVWLSEMMRNGYMLWWSSVCKVYFCGGMVWANE